MDNRVLDKLYVIHDYLHEMEENGECLTLHEDNLWMELIAIIMKYERIRDNG